jgi:esterase/lipase superfamily enzyme
MAAPDVDRDYYRQYAPQIRKLCEGMTLYASSNDKAMQISRKLAGGIPRAGDVPPSGPILVQGVEAIDVSTVGADLLGLNHDVFASRREVMDDIGLLLKSVPRRGPTDRLAEILGVPEGAANPQWWRYGR